MCLFLQNQPFFSPHFLKPNNRELKESQKKERFESVEKYPNTKYPLLILSMLSIGKKRGNSLAKFFVLFFRFHYLSLFLH